VISVSPEFGPVGGGTPVTIQGRRLSGAVSVRFGSLVAAFIVDNDTQISATSPRLPSNASAVARVPSVVVRTLGGSSAESVASLFAYVDPIPLVTGVEPASGPAGTTVAPPARVLLG
jgi:IPT/TIG domain